MGNGNNWFLTRWGSEKWKIVQWDHNNVLEGGGASLCGDSCTANAINWSILRPTCGAVHENQLYGPLLTKPELMEEYLGYVKLYLDTILTDEFLQEISELIVALTGEEAQNDWLVPPPPSFTHCFCPPLCSHSCVCRRGPGRRVGLWREHGEPSQRGPPEIVVGRRAPVVGRAEIEEEGNLRTARGN